MTLRTFNHFTGGTTGKRPATGRGARARSRTSTWAWPKLAPEASLAWETTCASILIVDDNDNAALFMQEVLEDAGYNVGTVTNVDSATDYLARVPVDLVILDWQLVAPRGGELLDGLPKYPGLAVPATIVTTGARSKRLKLAGTTRQLAKPLHADELRQAVATCLGNARATTPG